jgi:hypothetical protein
MLIPAENNTFNLWLNNKINNFAEAGKLEAKQYFIDQWSQINHFLNIYGVQLITIGYVSFMVWQGYKMFFVEDKSSALSKVYISTVAYSVLRLVWKICLPV